LRLFADFLTAMTLAMALDAADFGEGLVEELRRVPSEMASGAWMYSRPTYRAIASAGRHSLNINR
jgi:hypothetical protein